MKRWDVKTRWLSSDGKDFGTFIQGLRTDWLCGCDLEELFTIPDGTKQARLWAHSHSNKDAVPIFLKYQDDDELGESLDWGVTKLPCLSFMWRSLKIPLDRWGIKQLKKLGLIDDINIKVYVSLELR